MRKLVNVFKALPLDQQHETYPLITATYSWRGQETYRNGEVPLSQRPVERLGRERPRAVLVDGGDERNGQGA